MKQLLVAILMCAFFSSYSQENIETRWDKLIKEVKTDVNNDEVLLEKTMGKIKEYESLHKVKVIPAVDWEKHKNTLETLNKNLSETSDASNKQMIQTAIKEISDSEISYTDYKKLNNE